jgi:transglutaminase-like putative cysteine protease
VRAYLLEVPKYFREVGWAPAIMMKIHIGFDLTYTFDGFTPMILMLNVHPSRRRELITPDVIRAMPARSITPYVDGFGNKCVRLLAPPGMLRLTSNAIIGDTGFPDKISIGAEEHNVADLPPECLVFLLPSRYCETDVLMNTAWELFGNVRPGWGRVAAICDFVHNHIAFNYLAADATRGAARAFEERRGVCRDYAHLAVTFCRCLNIPARYCTGYLGDIGVPVDPAPMDFSAWFEAFIGGAWYTFDARHNFPRIGRVLIGRGRDAADVAISTTFGRNELTAFKVLTEEYRQSVTDSIKISA